MPHRNWTAEINDLCENFSTTILGFISHIMKVPSVFNIRYPYIPPRFLVQVLLFTLCSCFEFSASAQDSSKFEKEVEDLVSADSAINKKDVILFTGSSSIRIWTSIQSDFPKYNIVSRGFGGSETGDLLYYFDKLILPYNPKKIFIYEGDNDLNSGKSPDEVLTTMDSLITLIRTKISSKVQVYLISPKPSLSRWHLKARYEEYNKKLQALVSTRKKTYFVDVWSPSLDAKGNVLKDIFLEDGLHMNEKGYTIWVKQIQKYLP